jgi:hypothetical protein
MSSIVERFDTDVQPARTSAMGHLEVPRAKAPPAHAATSAGRRMLAALAWRNWSVAWRLTAVVVIAVVLDGVLGGLRLAAAAGSPAGIRRD